MDVELLDLISNNNNDIKAESIAKLLEIIEHPETVPVLFELLNIFYVSLDFHHFSQLIFLLQRIIKTAKWLNPTHLLSILDNLIYFLCIVPTKIAYFIIETIDLILNLTQQKFTTRLKKILTFYQETDKESEQINCLLFLSKYSVPFLTSVLLSEEQINETILNKILPKAIETIKNKQDISKDYYMVCADLISSVMNEFSFIPPFIEELALLLIEKEKDKYFVINYLLGNDGILLWPSFNIFNKFKIILNSNEINTHIKSQIIESLISFLQSESTQEEVINLVKDIIFDLDIDSNEREYEDSVEFEMNINPDLSQNSYRGFLLNFVEVYLNIIENDEELKQQIDMNVDPQYLNISGLKLYSENEELDSFGFGFLIKAKLQSLTDEEKDFLINNIETNFSSTCLMALYYSDKERAISIAQSLINNEKNTNLFNITLSFVLSEVNFSIHKKQDLTNYNLENIFQILDEWENIAKNIDEDEIPDFDSSSDKSNEESENESGSELEQLLTKCTKIINKQENMIPLDFCRKLVDRILHLLENYRNSYCDTKFSKLLKAILFKCDKFVDNITQIFYICENILSNDGELNDNLMELLCFISAREELNINQLTITILGICNEILENKTAQSAAPFILLAILIQKNPLSIESANICFPYFSQDLQEEEWFAGSVILLTSALIQDETFKVPLNVINFWIENVDFVNDQRVLKYSAKGLTILSKRGKYEGIDLAIKLASEMETDQKILADYVLPFDSLI